MFSKAVNFLRSLSNSSGVIDGMSCFNIAYYFVAQTAFKLYDSHGIPLDMIEDISHSLGYSVDVQGIKELKEISVKKSKQVIFTSNYSEVLVLEKYFI